ncbi:MAG: hypothetical protein IAF02_11600 [Anaerolineae bacterium]|nr:hypothetical protein [Anaerolineae bacterium]
MKKSFGIFLSLLLLLGLMVACGGEEDLSDEYYDEESEAYGEETAVIPQTDEVTQAEPSDKNADQASLIPAECFDSEDAFWECDEEGLIPVDCWDDDDEFIEACYDLVDSAPAETDSSSADEEERADEVAAAPANAETPANGAADSGFRPEVDGFSFENYGGEDYIVNLTAVEMQRMFGDQACANQTNGCTLTPPARQWMEQMNEGMSGGHCEGMAVLSSLMYYDKVEPAEFGGNLTNELSLDNEALQREIAYWWVTQATWPGGYEKVNESPSAVLDTMINAFADGKSATEWWALGIYKRDFSGGHAITPYAVEDQGNGLYHVFVYDNNYPNETRIMEINRDEETWSYEASTNPDVEADLYEGDIDTQTLEVVAISPRLQEQEGDFSEASAPNTGHNSTAKLSPTNPDVIQVWLDGETNLLITTEDGRRIGWLDDGSFVNEIEGADSANLRFGIDVWDIDEEPVYLLPTDVESFTVTVDGSQLEEASPAEVTIIGPGYTMVIEDLWLDPGESDSIDIEKFGPQYYGMTYSSDYSDSPDIVFGIETDDADYEFILRGTDLEPGGAFNVELDYPNGDFILNTTGQEEYGIYQLLILRIDDEGEHVFGHNEIVLEPNDTMYANFLDWEGEGSSLYLDFDYESDGTLDDYIELEDREDFYDDFYTDWEE